MSHIPNVQGQVAVRVFGKVIFETRKAYQVDLEGDQYWFPKMTVRNNGDGTLDIVEFWYNKNVK